MTKFDITIAGEINLDLILYGLPEQVPTEREVLASDFRVTLGSSSAILAHNISVLGTHTGFITRAGTDSLGRIALDRLAASGADLSHIVYDRNDVSTGVTVLLNHGTGQGMERHILTYPGTMAQMTVGDLDLEYLKHSRHFHVSSLFLQTALAPDLPWLFRELKQAGLTLSLDTNDDPSDRWNGVLDELLGLVDILLPNEAEACRIARRGTLDQALNVLSARVPCIAVKRGRRGSLVRASDETITAKPVNVTPVDTIGAGDSFNAGFLCAWLQHLPLEQCAYAGNVTGAFSTLRPGGTEAFRDQALLDAFLTEHAFPLKSVTQ